MNVGTPETDRQTAIVAFVRQNFGARGAVRLHRSALGLDLLRAPVNVVLAPVLILVRLSGLLARLMRMSAAADWLSGRRVLLQTDVSREVTARLWVFFAELDAKGVGVAVQGDVLEREIADYTGVRSAVGEIATTVLVLLAGFAIFRTVTPGLVSLTGSVAELRAHARAIQEFPLGQGIGRMYYSVFSSGPEIWQLVATGLVLAMALSVVTTFAGLVVDPLQLMTGTHRRRLSRLVIRLERSAQNGGGLAREHLTARFADVADMALNLWRFLRG